jgi:hypothetical protein
MDRFCLTVSLEMPEAVLLSVCKGVGGWGWPDGAGLFAVVEEGCELSLGGAGEDFAHDLA